MESILFPAVLVISALIMWIEKLRAQRADLEKRLATLNSVERQKNRDERLKQWAKTIADPDSEMERLKELHSEETLRAEADFRAFRDSWKPSVFQYLVSPFKKYGKFEQWKSSQIHMEFCRTHSYPEKEELSAKIHALKMHS